MVDQRHKTTVEIAVDDRGLRQVHNTIRQVFSITEVAAFNKEIERVTQNVTRMTQRMVSPGAGRWAGAVAGPGGRPTMIGVPGGMGRAGVPAGVPAGAPPGAAAAAGMAGGEPAWVGKLIGAIQGQRQPMGFGGTAAATGAGVMAGNWLSRAGGVGAGAARGEGFAERMLGAVPGFGPALSASVGTARQYAGEYQAHRRQFSGVQGAIGMRDARPEQRQSLRMYGISPTEIPSRFAEIGQAAGMRGSDLGDFATRALMRERSTGLGVGQQAALVGAESMGTAGGRGLHSDAAQGLISEAIETGMVAGFRDAKFGDLMADIAGHIEGLRTRGIMADSSSTMMLLRKIGSTGRLGLTGEPGLAAVKSMEGVVRGAPDKSDFGSAMMMQLAMEKTGSPWKAMMALEQDPAAMIPEALKRITKMGGDEDAQAFGLHQWMGGGISRLQSQQLVQGSRGGEMTEEAIQKILAKEQMPALNEEGKQEVLTGRKAREMRMYEEAGGRAGFATAATAAQQDQQRLNIGWKHVGVIQELQNAEIKLAAEGAKLGSEMTTLATQIMPAAVAGMRQFTTGMTAVVDALDAAAAALKRARDRTKGTGDEYGGPSQSPDPIINPAY